MVVVELRHLAPMAAIVEEGTSGGQAWRAAGLRTTDGQSADRAQAVWITPHGVVVLEQGRDLLAKAEALADAVERFKVGDGRTDIGTLSRVRARVGSSSGRPARNPPSPRLTTPPAR
jgi:hypothetical protein